MNRNAELIVLLPEIKRRFSRDVATQDFGLLQGSEEVVIQLNIKLMRTDRQPRQIDHIVALLAHRRKIGCKGTAFF